MSRQRSWILITLALWTVASVVWLARESPGRAFVVPAVAAATPAGGPYDVPRTLALAEEVSAALGRLRARCLATQGFPHATEALALRRPAAGTHRRRALELSLMDFGPGTLAEARRYGFGGSELAFDTGDRGILISRSPAFEAASLGCDSWITTAVSPGLFATQTEAAQFQDRVEMAYVARVTTALRPVLADRVRCLRDSGYPALDVEAFLEAHDMTDPLRGLGIAPGRHRAPAPGPTPDDVAPGQVAVFPPQPPATYTPSPAEVRLAEVYVACAGRTGFAAKVRAAAARARTATSTRHAGEAARLGRELDHHLAALGTGR